MSTKVKKVNLEKGPNTKSMKAKELLTISQGLAYLNSKETKVWHTISKNLDHIAPMVEKINDAHKVLTDKLATKDEHGNAIRNEQNQIDFGDNMAEANKSWQETLDTDVEFNLITIKLEDVNDYGLDANIMKPLLGTLVIE
jgi:hypothetical protein|tara:strand:- start:149 stop:571 length:423 start_codon:yes stop_codon:yes gene_type:complete